MARHKNQIGVTLLELLITLSILGTVMAGVNSLIDIYIQQSKSNVAAEHLNIFSKALNAYIKDNYGIISGAASSTTPLLVTAKMLADTGYLDSGINKTDIYNHSLCGLILSNTKNGIDALVVTEDGTTLNDVDLGSVVASLGASGGGIYTTDTNTVKGTAGNWSTPISKFSNPNNKGVHCDGVTPGPVSLSVGHPVKALWFSDYDTTSSLLYRDEVLGKPQLNTMNTPLIMGAINTSGDACTKLGAISRDTSGMVITCQGQTAPYYWKLQGSAYWGDPVSTKAILDALPCTVSDNTFQTRIVKTPATGTTARAYYCNGTAWTPLFLDDLGNLTIPGKISTDKIELTGIAKEDSDCAPNNSVGISSTGQLLTCQGLKWKATLASTKTGLHGVFYPLRGKSISCTTTNYYAGTVNYTATASVDNDGNLHLSLPPYSCTNTLVCGYPSGSYGATVNVSLVGINAGSWNSYGDGDGQGTPCSVNWPLD